MTTRFTPDGRPAWIGSLPIRDHQKAIRLVDRYSPEIPIWIQLPAYAAEGMLAQFAGPLPGLVREGDRMFIDAGAEDFDQQVLEFFEESMAVAEGAVSLADSRFALDRATAPGFFELLAYLDRRNVLPAAVKGQVTGPFTFATGINDAGGRAIFYNDTLREAAVTAIALNARWQTEQLKKYGVPVILFLDEPGLAGFGSSAFISVTGADVAACLEPVIREIHSAGGLAGVHVCANTDWSLMLDASLDIISFDAYSFFDKFLLYPDGIRNFLNRGGILAWGIVPTGDPEQVRRETTDTLFTRLEADMARLAELGVDPAVVAAQSLITPSCGVGSLPAADAVRVIEMTREISDRIRIRFNEKSDVDGPATR
jgi:hypothetical protein